MTHQLDMMPAELITEAVLDRIDAQLPKPREVRAQRLPSVLSDELHAQPMEVQPALIVDAAGEKAFHVERMP